jgi:drug/metabolite transporter (DMT)-like permease
MLKRSASFFSIEPTTALVVVLTVSLWASAFAGIRAALSSYTPESLALLRYLSASLALIIYAVITRMPVPRWKDLPGLAAIGFIGFSVYNVVLNIGEETTQAGPASLIIASSPIFVALMAGIFFKDRLPPSAWIGIGISFLGVALISFHPGEGLQISSSALLLVLAALASAGYSIAQKSFLKRYTPMQVTSYAIWFGTLFLLVFTPGLLRQLPNAALPATLAAVYMGIFPGAIGYAGWSYVLSRMPASKAGSFLYLVPGVSILIAWVWLGEVPNISALLGGVLILAGVIWVNVKKSTLPVLANSQLPGAVEKP